MSKIKDTQSAKIGLSGLFGTPSTQTGGLSPLEDKPLSSREEIEETMGEETKEALQAEIRRRQYLKSGRPPGTTKGKERKSPESVPMTFRVSQEKQIRLREIALQRGLFISEILDRAIDLVIAEYEKEERV
jgi:hypothetical protein